MRIEVISRERRLSPRVSLSENVVHEKTTCLTSAHMTTQTLVVAGDSDVSSHLTVRGADWHADAYHHSPGADGLLTIFGAKHGFGGIAGCDAKETDDEDPDRLSVTQRMTWAYLRSTLYPDDPAWPEACRALEENASSQGRVECK